MLNCKDITDNACDYLEKHLPWRKRLQVRLHLLLCHHCRRYVRQISTTVGLLKCRSTTLNDDEAKQIVEKIIKQRNCED